ncbi:MAG: hypothetical protein OXM02_07270 [Bacteroidota bacterium]|nr:hypothetical protein [Bacteroidota bacterium]
MQYSRYPDRVFQIVKDENVLYKVVTDLWMQAATDDGYLIEVNTGELDQSGFLPNPKVILYELELN